MHAHHRQLDERNTRCRSGRSARPEAADLNVRAESNAEVTALSTQVCLALAQPRIVDVRHGAIESLRVVAEVVHEAEIVGVREAFDEVLAPQLGRIHADLECDEVDHALHHMRRLGAAGAAIRVRRRAIGEDADAPRVDRLPLVGATTDQARDHLKGTEDPVVGPDVEELRELQTEQRTVTFGRNLHVEDLTAPVRRGQQALGAVLDPFHRPLDDLRRCSCQIFLEVRPDLGAESATDVMADNAELRLGDAECATDEEPDEVRHLGRRPEGHAIVIGHVVGHATSRLHRRREQPLLADPLLDHHLGFGEGRLDVAGGERCVPSDVVGTVALHQRAARRHRLLEIHHSGERLVVHDNELGRIIGKVSIFRDHHRHRLACIDDLVLGDRELVGHLLLIGDKGIGDREGGVDVGLEVGGGEDGHNPRRCQRCARVNRSDASMGMRAAHDRHVRHVHEVDVVDEVAVPGDELGILTTLDARSDHGGDSHG